MQLENVMASSGSKVMDQVQVRVEVQAMRVDECGKVQAEALKAIEESQKAGEPYVAD